MTDVLATTRCPQCAALVRPGQPWCTLCLADLRPAPTTAQEVLQPSPGAPDFVVDPLSGHLPAGPDGPLQGPVPPAPGTPAGRHARQPATEAGAGPRLGADAAAQQPSAVGEADRRPSDEEIDAMLAELATQTADPLAGVVGRLDSRAAKVGLAIGFCAVALAGMMLGAFVLAAIFG